MLEFLGPHTTLCNRFSRREMLRLGALAPLGLSLPQTQQGPLFGHAKRCL